MLEYQDYTNKKLTADQLKAILKEALVPKQHKLKDLVLLEKNANIMPQAKFLRLVDNIKRDGRLTQWPFVMRLPNGKYGVPSGNHRIKAGIEAGIEQEWCITCEVTLPKDEALRIQVSHNAIHGDQQNIVLLELADEFGDTELLRLSGADFDLAKINQDKLEFLSIDTGGLDFREILFYFTDYEVKKLEEVLVDLEKRIEDTKNPTYILEKQRYQKLVQAITESKNQANIKSTATVINLIIDYVFKHREDFIKELLPEKKSE